MNLETMTANDLFAELARRYKTNGLVRLFFQIVDPVEQHPTWEGPLQPGHILRVTAAIGDLHYAQANTIAMLQRARFEMLDHVVQSTVERVGLEMARRSLKIVPEPHLRVVK